MSDFMSNENDRHGLDGRAEAKALAKAESLLADSERLVARQEILLEELRAAGLRTVEAESSLARLKVAAADFKMRLDTLLVKARHR